MITRINAAPGLFRPRIRGQDAYSQVVVSDRPRLVFIAGQLARDADGRVVGAGDMRAQMRQVGENLKLALAAAGATLDDLVQTCTFVTSFEKLAEAWDIRQEYLGACAPTSTTVEVKALAGPEFLIEISAIAVPPAT